MSPTQQGAFSAMKAPPRLLGGTLLSLPRFLCFSAATVVLLPLTSALLVLSLVVRVVAAAAVIAVVAVVVVWELFRVEMQWQRYFLKAPC